MENYLILGVVTVLIFITLSLYQEDESKTA